MPTHQPKTKQPKVAQPASAPQVTPNPNYVPPPLPAPIPMTTAEALKLRTWKHARQVIKDELAADPKPGGLRHAFVANVAMLMYDVYGMDHATANHAADNIVKLVLEDTYY